MIVSGLTTRAKDAGSSNVEEISGGGHLTPTLVPGQIYLGSPIDPAWENWVTKIPITQSAYFHLLRSCVWFNGGPDGEDPQWKVSLHF